MKNKILITIASIVSTLSVQSSADYLIKYNIEPAPNSIFIVGWFDTSPIISDWTNIGSNFDCSIFLPATNTIVIDQTFEQTRTCSINEEKVTQNRKISEKGIYKNEGIPIIETRVSSIVEKNNAIGSKDCRYEINNYNWRYYTTLETVILWAGQTVYYDSYTSESNYYSSVIANGYRYIRSSSSNDNPGIYYGVCREKL